MTEFLLFIAGVVILLGLSYAFYRWYMLYSKRKGRNSKSLFETGFFGPSYIKVDDEYFSVDERRQLNNLLGIIYCMISIFIVLSVLVFVFFPKTK